MTPAEKTREALRTLARQIYRSTRRADEIHTDLTTFGLDARDRFHAFAALRHATLGSRDAGDLSGALRSMTTAQVSIALRNAADLVFDF